ncbi:MAG: glycerophosphodiester phosphodiesterase [Cyclobacteriaceae bacterium]|nr:glycerophosphodiester phosphodiesterase [Cyclobacteriaceae bacterium]
MNLALLILILTFIPMEEASVQTGYPTKVIAHRGAWKNTNVPENSIAALQNAIALKCYGSEFDVHLSADSVPFVLHDHSIQDIYIEKTNAAELSNIKLSNGEVLPTLESYLLAGKNQNQTRLILEIKTSQLGKARSLASTKKCVELVNKLGVASITDYIAFDFDVCLEVKKLAPQAHVQYLNGDKTPEQLAAAGLSGFDYHYSILQKNENWLADAHQRKLSTNAWTVNDETIMQWLIDRNVGMITTNEPEKLIRLLSK